MMNMLTSRLLNAGLIVVAAVLAPVAAFAQDATAATMMDNSSPAIGFLVIWLLGIGGLLAVVAGTYFDKQAQARRVSGITTRR